MGRLLKLLHSDGAAGSPPPSSPVNTVLPVISGNTYVGQLLSTTDGTWTGSPSSYAYQWKRNGSDIGGATSNTYTLVQADATAAITVVVTATNGGGSTPATSAATAVIYDSLLQGKIALATSLSYALPTSAYLTLENTLIVGLRSLGVLSTYDCLQIYASNSGDNNYSSINVLSPSTIQATFINSPAYVDKNGVKPNGSTSYVDTGFNATSHGVNYTLNNAQLSVYITDDVSTGAIYSGIAGSVNNRIAAAASTTGIRLNSSNNLSSTVNSLGTGIKSVHRTSSTAVEVFIGATQSSRTQTSTAIANEDYLPGRSNTAYGNATHAAFWVGSADTTNQSAVKALWDTFITGVQAL